MEPSIIVGQDTDEICLAEALEDLHFEAAIGAMHVRPRFERSLGVMQPACGRVESKLEPPRGEALPELDVFAARKRAIKAPHRGEVALGERGVSRPKLAKRGRVVSRTMAAYCASSLACSQATQGCLARKRRHRAGDHDVGFGSCIFRCSPISSGPGTTSSSRNKTKGELGARHPRVARRRGPLVGLLEHGEPEGVTLRAEPLGRAIDRPVVDDHHFEPPWPDRLRRERRERGPTSIAGCTWE